MALIRRSTPFWCSSLDTVSNCMVLVPFVLCDLFLFFPASSTPLVMISIFFVLDLYCLNDLLTEMARS